MARSSQAIPLGRHFASVLILAGLAHGCGGGGDGDGASPAPPDTTAPAVSVIAPAAAVNRTVTLRAQASDNVAVTEVRFLADGALIGTATSTPFEVQWNTSALADGNHTVTAEARDAAGNSTTSAALTVEVRNLVTLDLSLSPEQEFPVPRSSATGSGTLTVNLLTGAISGEITSANMVATAAHIHDGYAGQNGPIIIGFEQDAADPNHWSLPANATLTSAQADRLVLAALYVNVHSAAYPGGEIRSQILLPGIRLFYTDLESRQQTDLITSAGSGRAAITLFGTTAPSVVIHANTVGLSTITAAHLHQAFAGADGAVIVSLSADPQNAAHWFTESGVLSQASGDALLAGGTYVNVHTPLHPDGEIRGQVLPAGIDAFIADLTGEEEVPAVSTGAFGRGAVTLDRTTLRAQIHVNTRAFSDANAAHLHGAFGGVSGPILVGLTQDGSNPAHWFAENQTLAQADADQLLAGGTYLNVHSPAHAAGEIRGQVVPAEVLFLFARLSGDQEVPAVAGTASGTSAITVDRASRALVGHINTSDLGDAVAAHIHQAFAGANGPIIVNFTQDTANASHWSATGVTLSQAQFDAMLAAGTYVNAHTPAHQGGAVRGQLVPDGIEVLFNDLAGTDVVPPTASAATGAITTTVNLDSGRIVANLSSSVASPTAATINRGAVGTNGPVIVALEQNAANPAAWAVDTTLATADLEAYRSDELYALVSNATLPDGAIRGQIAHPAPPGDTTSPTVTLTALPATVSGTIAVEATATDDVGVTEVVFLVNGAPIGSDTTAPYSVQWNTTTVANGQATVTAEAHDTAGNVGQAAPITVTVSNTAPVTLTQIQSSVFTPICSACHTGGGAALPAAMNLTTAAASFSALVNVSSLEIPSRMRVAPGNPDASYLIQKLEGTPGIVGDRMPQFGAPLPPATIAQIREWIANGAPNN